MKEHRGNHWNWASGRILERIGKVNYLVRKGGRNHKCHVNDLRKDERRELEVNWLAGMLTTWDPALSQINSGTQITKGTPAKGDKKVRFNEMKVIWV